MWNNEITEAACTFISRGISPKYNEKAGVLVLNQKCVRNHLIDYSVARRHDILEKKVKSERFIQKGDVLINSTGQGTLGRVAQVREEPPEPTTVDSHVTILRPDPKKFYLDYFGYALIQIEDELKNSGQGTSGQTELAKSKIQKQFSVKYPSDKEEQKRIVERLDKAFAEIDKGVDRHSKSAHLVDKLFSKLIVNFLSDAQGTRTTTIGDISDMQSGYAFKSKDYSDDSEDVRLLRGDNIAAGSVDLTSSKRLPASIAKNYGKFELMAGDLVLAMDRPYISSGLRLARIHQQHLPCLLVQRVMRLRASPDISSDYLQLVMETPEFLEHILGRQTGLGVPHISGKTIGTFPFELPDLARQSQIVQQFIAAKDGASKLLDARRECIAEAKKLKAAILKQELTPSEAV